MQSARFTVMSACEFVRGKSLLELTIRAPEAVDMLRRPVTGAPVGNIHQCMLRRIEQRSPAAVRRATSAIWKVSAITAGELVMRPRPQEFADVVKQSVVLTPIKVAGREFNRRCAGRSKGGNGSSTVVLINRPSTRPTAGRCEGRGSARTSSAQAPSWLRACGAGSAINPLSSGTSKRRITRAGAISELILHPAERRMRPVFDLDPMPEPAAAI